MTVDNATAVILKSNPPQVGIAAAGTVSTTGWTHPALEPWFYIAPPADGILDFDFGAMPPDHIVLPMTMPIAAHAVITRDPRDYWGEGKPLAGVRIHARQNSVVAMLDAKASSEARLSLAAKGGIDPVPWPWLAPGVHIKGDGDPFPIARAAALGDDIPFPIAVNICLAQLTGKTVRVFHTGDVLTMDYRPERLNLELNPQTERIVRAFFG
jgi:hypothetical protein